MRLFPSISVKMVACKSKSNARIPDDSICVDLNGDGEPDETFCQTNGSTISTPSHRQGFSESGGEKMSVSYSQDWPSLDVILEKGSEVNGVVELGRGGEDNKEQEKCSTSTSKQFASLEQKHTQGIHDEFFILVSWCVSSLTFSNQVHRVLFDLCIHFTIQHIELFG